jgi:hypothetical protein
MLFRLIDLILLLLSSARTFRLECLTIDIDVWFVNERMFLAVFNAGCRFSCTISVGRMEETRETALGAAYFGDSFERIAFEQDLTIFVDCSLCLDSMWVYSI